MGLSLIYVVVSSNGHVKVGVTNRFSRRLSGLQTASAFRLRPAFLAACPNAYVIEQEAHRLLLPKRMVGEWFSCGAADAIAAIAQASKRCGVRLDVQPLPLPRGAMARTRSGQSAVLTKLQPLARDYSTFTSPLPHPGEVLREDFMPDYDLTAGALAKAMGLKDRTRIERVVRGAQPITPDTALRLGRVFGTSAELWLGMQAAHDLSVAAIASRESLGAIQTLEVA